MSRRLSSTGPGSCRQCAITCERVVYPAGCLRAGCARLYHRTAGGRTWMGCAAGVYAVQIDAELFARMQRTAAGFGALRVARPPLPVCDTEVQRTFAHRGGGPCVNPDFLLSGADGGYLVHVADADCEERAA